jgi:tetratricopeptide (TPR) repeat protein
MIRQQSVFFSLMLLLGALLPFVLAGSAAAQGDTQSTKILGTVTDAATHQPVVSARVDLMSPKGFASPTQYTNTDGIFYFDRIGDGDYHLRVRKIDYLDTESDVTVIANHQTRIELELHHVVSDAGTAPSSSETISSHQLTVPVNARDEYKKGKELMAKKDYSGALAQFNKAVNDYAPYYEAYADIGVVQFLLGHAPEARASLQKSLDLSEQKYPDAVFDMADLLNDTQDYAGAEPLAREEVVLEDSSWRGYYQLARALLGLRQLPDADRNAKKAQLLNPEDPKIYVILTNIHIARRDYASVLQDIDGYLKLDPDSPASQQMRATRAQVSRALAAAPAPSSSTPH